MTTDHQAVLALLRAQKHVLQYCQHHNARTKCSGDIERSAKQTRDAIFDADIKAIASLQKQLLKITLPAKA